MRENQVLQSCISHINNAKADIEKLSTMSMSQKAKDEFGLAYNSLNDTINHCNTGMQSL